LRLLFEDEARFGRMSDPIRCWAPLGCRPQVSSHRVRQYTHVFGSVCPQDGEFISLILPHADTAAMSLYLAEVSRRHPHEHILMFLDRAGWHRAKALVVPDNLTLDWLPAYSPQCNPEELGLAGNAPAALWQSRLSPDGRGRKRLGTPPAPTRIRPRLPPIPHRL
jgi:hypothetical protein